MFLKLFSHTLAPHSGRLRAKKIEQRGWFKPAISASRTAPPQGGGGTLRGRSTVTASGEPGTANAVRHVMGRWHG